jgi:hypothetical protein
MINPLTKEIAKQRPYVPGEAFTYCFVCKRDNPRTASVAGSLFCLDCVDMHRARMGAA